MDPPARRRCGGLAGCHARGHPEERLPNTLAFTVSGTDGIARWRRLICRRLCVQRVRLLCGVPGTSHALHAMGVPAVESNASCDSPGPGNDGGRSESGDRYCRRAYPAGTAVTLGSACSTAAALDPRPDRRPAHSLHTRVVGESGAAPLPHSRLRQRRHGQRIAQWHLNHGALDSF